MPIDTAKLPAKKWLTLSQVINFLAFNDVRDEEAMERDGYPSDIVWGSKIAQILERCRREAITDPRCAAFVKTVGTAGPLVQNHPISMRLQECEAAWPASGQQLHELIVQWERDRDTEYETCLDAQKAMKNVLVSVEVDFEGCRDGRRELVNVDLIDENSVIWGDECFAADPIDDGPTLIWTEVRVNRPSLEQWLAKHSAAKATPPKQEQKRPGPKKYYGRAAVKSLIKYVQARPQVPGVNPPDEKLWEEVQRLHKKKWPTKPVPSRSTLQRIRDEPDSP